MDIPYVWFSYLGLTFCKAAPFIGNGIPCKLFRLYCSPISIHNSYGSRPQTGSMSQRACGRHNLGTSYLCFIQLFSKRLVRWFVAQWGKKLTSLKFFTFCFLYSSVWHFYINRRTKSSQNLTILANIGVSWQYGFDNLAELYQCPSYLPVHLLRGNSNGTTDNRQSHSVTPERCVRLVRLFTLHSFSPFLPYRSISLVRPFFLYSRGTADTLELGLLLSFSQVKEKESSCRLWIKLTHSRNKAILFSLPMYKLYEDFKGHRRAYPEEEKWKGWMKDLSPVLSLFFRDGVVFFLLWVL